MSEIELPRSWQLVSLGTIIEAHYGKALPEKNRNSQGGVLVVGSSGIVGTHDQYIVEKPCIVIGRKGSVGAVYLLNTPCWPIDTTYYIQSPPGIQASYLFYLLGSLELVRLDKSTTIPGLNREDFYRTRAPIAPSTEQTRIVEKLEELLSDLEAGVAELKAAQKKLAQYRQSLLKAAVEGALTADWRASHNTVRPEPFDFAQESLVEGRSTPTLSSIHPSTVRQAHSSGRTDDEETGAQLLERILKERRARWEVKQLAKFQEQGKIPPMGWQDKYAEPVKPDTSNLPELPEGWVWASLDMLGEIVSGVTKGTKRDASIEVKEVPYLRVANVQRGYLDLTEVKTILATKRDIEELTLQAGDVLFNEGGDRDKLGRGWVWRDEVANCIHQNHVFRMRVYLPEIIPELISHHGNTFGKTWFQSAGKQTTNLASINMGILRAFPVPVAPSDEQIEILSLLEQQIDVLKIQEKSVSIALIQSAAQRLNILKAAFSGQLAPQDPNDEPASVLLERIRSERAAQLSSKAPKKRSCKAVS